MKAPVVLAILVGASLGLVLGQFRSEGSASLAQQNSVDSREPQKLTGFRYQDCGVQDCVVIEAPAAWLSQMSNFGDSGSHFLAEGPVKMQILREGRLWRQYQGESASLQSEVKLLSMETPRGSVLYDLETRQVDELFTANQQGVSGGGAL
jgi:hypothetical protein